MTAKTIGTTARLLAWALLAVLMLVHARSWAQAGEQQKEEARSHFELGLSHFDREEWQAALVEFLKSRELFPSRGNTKNAAICLRKVGRFEEALEMFERLLHDFPDLSPTDRALAEREIAELKASLGTVQIQGAPDGASVTIDSIERGKTPLRSPIRLSAGTHMIRVTKEGALPFELRVDLAGGQAVVVRAQLAALTQAGRLSITEHGGRPAEVVVDGAVVGRVPWDGALAPGDHTVLLRGEGNFGTPPALVSVKLNQVTALDLVMQELPASLSVVPEPASALVTIDGVPLGRGAWAGRLAAGDHAVGATLEGYTAFMRKVTLAAGDRGVVRAKLEAISAPGGHVTFEVDLGLPLGLVTAGDLEKGANCSGACGASFPLGFQGVLHGDYSFPFGLGIGVRAGYMLLSNSISNRQTAVTSMGFTAHGTAADSLLLGGIVAGLEGQYRTRGDWPLTARLGVGAFVGSMRDRRTGTFTAQNTGRPFDVNTTQAPSATYMFVAPELRFGRKLGEHIEINVGAELLIMPALSPPRWDTNQVFPSGDDGQGWFSADKLAAPLLLALVPSIGAKYEF